MTHSLILRDWEVRGILEGQISQLRRPVKPQPVGHIWNPPNDPPCLEDDNGTKLKSPFGQVGDTIFGKEAWQVCPKDMCIPGEPMKKSEWNPDWSVVWKATVPSELHPDHPEWGKQIWRSPASMPQWASRIILQIDEIWVERVQEISEEDARANGIIDGGCLNCGNPEPCGCSNPQPDARYAFAYFWNNDYSKQGFDWIINPYVFAAKVRRVEG